MRNGRWRTLEIGAGLGGHVPFEDLAAQEYHVLELRAEFCSRLLVLPNLAGVHQADIQSRTAFEAGVFDRIIAIHVLEHLRNLPLAVDEMARLLAEGGILDLVLPCEGGFAYAVARRISAQPMFERRFKMPYGPIIANEHVSTLREVMEVVVQRFRPIYVRWFPFAISSSALNLCVALRMVKRGL